MHFVYENNPKNDDFNLGRLKKMLLNPNKFYNTHLDNYFFLKFIIAKSDKFTEKQQAEKELAVAIKKMEFWERQVLFDSGMQQSAIKQCREKWEMSDDQLGQFILKKICKTA